MGIHKFFRRKQRAHENLNQFISALRYMSFFIKTRCSQTEYKGPYRVDYRERGSHSQRCVSHTDRVSRSTDSQSEAKIRKRRSKHQNNSVRVVINLKERKIFTKLKSLKQGLTSAQDLTLKILEKRESTTIDQTNKLTRHIAESMVS